MQEDYATQADFWTKTHPRVVGDFLNRPRAIERLGSLEGKVIWDAGCGTGYVARLLAERGAQVTGSDFSQEMLRRAVAEEKKNPLGIEYHLHDIVDPKFPEATFDKVISLGVLQHNAPGKLWSMYFEMYRTLKPGGRLVVGILHYDMYNPGSVARCSEQSWIRLLPEEDLDLMKSQEFQQEYKDIDGNVFRTKVWHHPAKQLTSSGENAGFHLVETVDIKFPKRLTSEQWGNRHGYNAYLHLVFEK